MTPRGDIDGIILTDGTEVKVLPHLDATLASAIKIGDAITIHGLRGASLPLIAASSVANDATGASIVITAGPPALARWARDRMDPPALVREAKGQRVCQCAEL